MSSNFRLQRAPSSARQTVSLPGGPRQTPSLHHGVAPSTVVRSRPAAPPGATQASPPPDVASLAGPIVAWLAQQGLVRPADAQTPANARPWLRLEPTSPRAQAHQRALRAAFPQLDDGALDLIIWFLVRRAHAEHALPAAASSPLVRGLQRALRHLAGGERYSQVVEPTAAKGLLFLSAPHYDGCLFDPRNPSGRGGQGSFFVGLTRRGQPVAIKSGLPANTPTTANNTRPLPAATYMVNGGPVDNLGREAHRLRAADTYDVLHLVQHENHSYMVMPLLNGDMSQHAGVFVNLAPTPKDAASAQPGLFGARYLLQQALLTLVQLHERDRVVHQDVKAANLFVNRDRRCLVLGDFGVSAPLGPDGRAPHIGHTERYAAPEQRENVGSLTPATDLFGLGATLYDLLLQRCDAVRRRRAELPHTQLVPALMPSTRRVSELPRADREMFYLALADDQVSLTKKGAIPASQVHTREHFRNMHDALLGLDAPFAELLRACVSRDPEARPTAREALARLDAMGFDANAAPEALHAMWSRGVPPHAPDVHAQLTALGNALRAIDAEEMVQRQAGAASRARDNGERAARERNTDVTSAAFAQLGL